MMENKKFHFKTHTCNRRILVRKKNMGGEIIEELKWLDLRTELVIKWDWYFRYRKALLQVKYPRDYIDYRKWNTEPSEFTQTQIDEQNRKRNITTYKRMITKLSNGIEHFENIEKQSLLPNWEDPNYLKAKKKLNNYKLMLDECLKNNI